MPYAINLRSDDASSARIRTLWDEVSTFEKTPSMLNLGYQPHMSMAFFEKIEQSILFDAIERSTENEVPFSIRFVGMDFFETKHSIVLYLRPEPNTRLTEFHKSIHAAVPSVCIRPWYLPGKWMPHCSLATSVNYDKKSELMTFLEQTFAPFEVTFGTVDCVSFYPIEVIYERNL